MSAISLILLATAGTAVGLGAAALHAARGLRADVTALRIELAGRTVPAARPVPAAEIRSAVAEALADERERELAEARAYWAEQDARDGGGPGPLLAGGGLDHEAAAGADEELLDALLERYLLSDSGFATPASRDGAAFVPRQPEPDRDGAERLDGAETTGEQGERGEGAATAPGDGEAPECATPRARTTGRAGGGGTTGREAAIEPADGELDEVEDPEELDEAGEVDPAELAAARRRHPSHPGFTLTGEPVTDHQRTADRLARLAEARTPLTDVRPGPLGTLDVFLFADGTTLCLSPSHQQAAERLAEAVRTGQQPVLMGGSGISGAYALTFSCGQDSVYLLADRVVATSRQR